MQTPVPSLKPTLGRFETPQTMPRARSVTSLHRLFFLLRHETGSSSSRLQCPGPPKRARNIDSQRGPDRRCVKLLRILSPHAELSSTSKTSAALTELFCRLRLPVDPADGSNVLFGLGGRLSAEANCQSPSAGGEKGDDAGADGLLGIGDAGDMIDGRVGDPCGVVWIEFVRLRSVMSLGGVGDRTSLPDARQSTLR